MEELDRIRTALAGLLSSRDEAWRRHFLGLPSDAKTAWQAHPLAWHEESLHAVQEAQERAADEGVRTSIGRLLAAIVVARIRAAGLALDASLQQDELAAVVEGPEATMPLRQALRTLALDGRRGRRALLAEACLRSIGQGEGQRSDRLARWLEALERHHTDPWSLAGLDAEALAAQARAALEATGEPLRELLPRLLSHLEGAPAPLPQGDLAAHDLAALWMAGPAADALPAGALELTARRLVEGMGFDRRVGRVRLDLQRRPQARVGAVVARAAGGAVVSMAPLGAPADWAALFGALPRALRHVSLAPHLPVEDGRCGVAGQEAAFGALFSSALHQPLFYRRMTGAGRREAEEAALAFRTLAILELRLACARVLVEQEAFARGPSRAVATFFVETMEAATLARFDERLWATGLRPSLPAAHHVAGLALAAPLLPALRERCDEDWWRNPRTGPLLQGLWARGAAADPAQLLQAGAPSLEAWVAGLLAGL